MVWRARPETGSGITGFMNLAKDGAGSKPAVWWRGPFHLMMVWNDPPAPRESRRILGALGETTAHRSGSSFAAWGQIRKSRKTCGNLRVASTMGFFWHFAPPWRAGSGRLLGKGAILVHHRLELRSRVSHPFPTRT